MQYSKKSLEYIGHHGSVSEFTEAINAEKDNPSSLEHLAHGVQLLRNDKETDAEPYYRMWEIEAKERQLKSVYIQQRREAPADEKQPLLSEHFNDLAQKIKREFVLDLPFAEFKKILDLHGHDKAVLDLLEEKTWAGSKPLSEIKPLPATAEKHGPKKNTR